MHQNAIALSSDQASILKRDKCPSSPIGHRLGPEEARGDEKYSQNHHLNQHNHHHFQNNELEASYRRAVDEQNELSKDGRDSFKCQEIRSLFATTGGTNGSTNQDNNGGSRARELAQTEEAPATPTITQAKATTTKTTTTPNALGPLNQGHPFALATSLQDSIKIEMTNQEQVASSKQQQQQQARAQQDALMELLDTNTNNNSNNTTSQNVLHQSSAATATTESQVNQMVSPLQNGAVATAGPDQNSSAFCAGCQAQIRDKFIFSVIDLFWHQDCVQCADCSLKLDDRCYTLNGKLYCKHDYWHRFGPKCFACQQSIEQSELVQRIKGNRVYHLKCFACHECRRPLEQGEQLHLVGDKRLLCKQDFQRLNGCRIGPASGSIGSDSGGNGGDSGGGANGNSSGNGGSGNTPGDASAGGNTPGQASKQEPNSQSSNNNGSSSSSSYLTLLGCSIKTGGQAQKRSSLTSLDNMSETLGQVGEPNLVSQTPVAGQGGELDQEADGAEVGEEEDEEEAYDEDDEGVLETGGLIESRGSGPRRRRARDPSLLGLDDGMLNDQVDPFQVDENEENQMGRGELQQLDELGQANSNSPVKPIRQQQQQRHLLNPQQLANGARKKRRRKQRLSLASDKAAKQQAGQAKSAGAQKLLAGTRNGESILNGSATSSASQQQQSASILAGMQSPLDGAVGIGSKQQLKSSCSTSSTSSSSSNHSSSNSSTVTNSHHQDHHFQQQQHQQGAGHHRLGPNAPASGNAAVHHNHHHHHHATVGGQHQQQHQSQQSTGGGHKPTRVRTVLNEKQLQTLRDCYAQNPRPDALMKEQLVDMTGLSPRVIRVWFQNKRCKDKKKSILYKQMQQHEKDGRHLTGLTHIRGVPMVASSPVHYQDDHSPGANSTPLSSTVGVGGGGNGGGGGGGPADPESPQQIQQQQQRQSAAAPTVQSPPHSNQPLDIHAYQPPWKGLVEYAQQAPETAAQQPDRLNAASPRYQQLIGQIHGYGAASVACDHQVGGELHAAQQQQQQQQQQQYGGGQATANVYPQAQQAPQPQPPPPHHIQLQQQQQLIQQQQHHHLHHQSNTTNNNHLHHNHHLHHHHQPQQQHLAQVAANMAGHHANQFPH